MTKKTDATEPKDKNQLNDGQIIVYDKPLQMAPQNPYMELMHKAFDSEKGMEKLEKFMELSDKWEKKEAEKAFNRDFAESKKDCPKVKKDGVNTQYDSNYNTKGNTVDTITPHIAKFGFCPSWDFNQEGDSITVTCILSHVLGFSKKVSMSAPPDKSGAKNPIQQIKSTKTYLELATFESVLGLASTNATQDDDGNSSGQQEPVITISDKQEIELTDLIESKDRTVESVCKLAKIDKLSDLVESAFEPWMKKLGDIK